VTLALMDTCEPRCEHRSISGQDWGGTADETRDCAIFAAQLQPLCSRATPPRTPPEQALCDKYQSKK
jgi:hypothetical protein